MALYVKPVIACVQDSPKSGDEIVENIVANIHMEGICLHFRMLFTDLCP